MSFIRQNLISDFDIFLGKYTAIYVFSDFTKLLWKAQPTLRVIQV